MTDCVISHEIWKLSYFPVSLLGCDREHELGIGLLIDDLRYRNLPCTSYSEIVAQLGEVQKGSCVGTNLHRLEEPSDLIVVATCELNSIASDVELGVGIDGKLALLFIVSEESR